MYLVTGGGGFIGSHLVRALVHRGEHVRVLDNNSSGRPQRIADVRDEVDWIDGDIRDADTLRRVCHGVDVVLHQAAVVSVVQSVADPALTNDVNLTGTLKVLAAARDAGVRRLVFASSSAIYGNLSLTPKTEQMPTCPASPYGVQKLGAESYCRVWHALYGLETVVLRYFNVFGPGQDPGSEYAAVIPRFIAAALAGKAPTIFGDGEQSRDFIYVANVVDSNLLAATIPDAAGVVMNVGVGSSLTLNQLVAELGRVLGHEITPVYEPERPGDIRIMEADTSLMRATLQYEPAMSFADGLAETVANFRASTDLVEAASRMSCTYT